MTPYSEYKESRVPWLGKIPSHWKLLPCRAIVDNQVEKNDSGKIEEYLSLMANIGVVRYEEKGDVGNKKPEDLTKCKLVKQGNLVINSMNYAIGSYGMSPFNGVCSPVYIVLEPKEQIVERRYALRLFENKPMQKHLAQLGNGILQHRAAIKWDDIKPQAVPVPPLEEQRAILYFLDRETQRIDSLIAEKLTFIKLLKEKRQALISHIVTKGLNPNVEMQDSGIEWIGQVPKHWGISKVRYLGQCQNGINIGGEFFGHGTPFVSYGDVYNNTSLPEKVQGLVLSTEKDRDNYSVIAGDVLFTRTSETIEEIGFSAVCKSTIEQAVFAGFLIRFRPDEGNLEVGFSEYYFRNEKLRAFFAKEMNLVTRASLSQDLLKKMPVLLPPIDEQNEIANYLQAECNKFSEIFAETEKTILLLKERRTSLISAAVTGKIDVREAM
ncbi:restriction endonuclease S subunit [Vibrio cholerae RC385]|nr:restriction endonuclease subunit S [Vibrio cholerae]EFH72679.1 restriction endonuclease S subunit [Vibrio cholerae RC385]EKF9421888.1 restriction endonuclease subunit S [Vibrio cholerae]